MSDHERIEDLVAEFVERVENGEDLAPEEFVAAHPSADGLEGALHAALGALDLFPSGVSAVDRPDRIGEWTVHRELGRGGGGRVFEVSGADSAQRYALKLLNLNAVGNPRALERFRREGKILEALDHPGIVRVHEVSAGADLPYIVMDLVPGQSLTARLNTARRELRTSRVDRTPPTDLLVLPGSADTVRGAADLIARLAHAVEHAHAQGLLHRDLKPSNVLLDENGQPVLIDFGLAVSEESATLTESGDLLGTPHYMAPEQARGERADARTDVYGLGAVLYELLTLHPPHAGRDPLEVLQSIRTRPHVPVRKRNPAVPANLARVVDRALAWKPARRTCDAASLAADLEATIAGGRVHARRRGPVERVEDLLRFRPRAVALTTFAGLLVLAIAALFYDPAASVLEDHTEAIDQAHRRALVAWFDSREDDLAAEALWLGDHTPDDPLLALYVAEANDQIADPTGDEALDAVLEGLRAEAAERFSDALTHYNHARILRPSWALPPGLAGLLAAEEGPPRATRIADLELATRLLPESLRLARELARHLRLDGRPSEGRAVLQRVLETGKWGWHEWSEYAVCCLLDGDPTRAYEAIEAAIEVTGGKPPASVLSRKGAILNTLGESRDSARLYSELIARFPRDAGLRFNLGLTLDGECRLAEAAEQYLAAHELSSDSLEVLVNLAHLYAGSGMTDKACEKCAAVFEQHPELLDDEAALLWLGRAFDLNDLAETWLPGFGVKVAKRIGRPVEVRDLLRKHLDEDGDIDDRAVAIERALRKLERMIEEGGR